MPNTSVAYKTFSDILRESQPDIIHFFGTEFVYTDAFLDICIDCGFRWWAWYSRCAFCNINIG